MTLDRPINDPSTASKVFLTLAFGAAGYVTRLCFRSPNPTPRNRYANDHLIRHMVGSKGPLLRERGFALLTLAHIFTLWTLPHPPACPHPARLNRAYFLPSPYTLLSVALILAAGALRLSAFAALGPSFTFELAPPTALVTTGVYRYVQHPSYPPDFVLTVVNAALFANADGVAGCVLPVWVVEAYAEWKWGLVGGGAVLYLLGMAVRVRDEERMLREAFGREWEEWHRKTARFVPGLF